MSIINLLNRSTRKNKPKSVSKFYKKWLYWLKTHKLFDEYMIYMDSMFMNRETYPVADDYDTLYDLTKRLQDYGEIYVGNTCIRIMWHIEFISFVRDTVRWWDFHTKMKFLY